MCFDWVVGPNCGTHSEEEKEGGDESSLKEIRINRGERERERESGRGPVW